jgi:glutathione S-transferase
MSLTFYYVPMSTSIINVAVLAELNIDYEGVELDIDAGDTQSESFLKVNPNGRVPVIVYDGVTIWESVAITLYLGETFGVDKALFPEPGPRRGEAMKWVVWANLNLADAAGKLVVELPLDAPGALQKVSRYFVPAGHRHPNALADLSFLLNNYSIVATYLFVLIAWTLSMELDLSIFPHVEAWFAGCLERPVLDAAYNFLP